MSNVIIKFFLSFLIMNIFNSIDAKQLKFSKELNINLRKLESKNFITKVYYSEKDDNYYIKLYQGNIPTPQAYLIDTTFSLTSSPCNICDSCEQHLYPFFPIGNQTEIINCNSQECASIISPNSCYNENCIFNIEHNINKDKNIEGILINSTILINDTYNDDESLYDPLTLIITIPTGCTTKEGNFYKYREINGILGMNNGNNSFIDILYDLNIIPNNYYSICLSRKGGYLSLGQILGSGSYNNNNINYINLMPKSQYNLFELKINNVQIGEQYINQEYISYIDSSSKFSYFPTKFYNEIINFFYSEIKKRENKDDLFIVDEQYGYCRIFNNKEEEENVIYEKYPNIIINFDGFIFEWEPQNYIISYEIKEQNIVKSCFGLKESFENNNNESNNNKVILGTNFMIEHEIIFDKTNQKIAFINSNCQQIEYKNDSNNQIDDMKNDTQISENYNFITDKININDNNMTNENMSETILNELDNDTNISNYTQESASNEINYNISNYIHSDEITRELLTDIIDEETNDIIMNFTNEVYSSIIDYNESDNVNTSIMTIMTDSIYANRNEFLSSIINYSSISTSTNNENYTISDNISDNISDFINDNTIINSVDNTIKSIEDKSQKIEDMINFPNYTTLIINNKILSTNINTEKKEDENLFPKIKSTIINVEKENFISEKISENFNINNTEQKEKNNFNENDSNKTTDNYKNEYFKEKSFLSKMFDIIISFLKNKLIYFLLALIGIIACFFLIILISCAIISCFKMFKRRNYMEQIDDDIHKDSNYKTATVSSSSS